MNPFENVSQGATDGQPSVNDQPAPTIGGFAPVGELPAANDQPSAPQISAPTVTAPSAIVQQENKMPIVKQGVVTQPLASNQVELRDLTQASGIKVTAIGKGNIYNQRKEAGDEFVVLTAQELGSWMRCDDPDYQKQHLAAMNRRKQEQQEARQLKARQFQAMQINGGLGLA